VWGKVLVFCASLKQAKKNWHFCDICCSEFDENTACSNIATATATQTQYVATALVTMTRPAWKVTLAAKQIYIATPHAP
jgi:hypothetical protein